MSAIQVPSSHPPPPNIEIIDLSVPEVNQPIPDSALPRLRTSDLTISLKNLNASSTPLDFDPCGIIVTLLRLTSHIDYTILPQSAQNTGTFHDAEFRSNHLPEMFVTQLVSIALKAFGSLSCDDIEGIYKKEYDCFVHSEGMRKGIDSVWLKDGDNEFTKLSRVIVEKAAVVDDPSLSHSWILAILTIIRNISMVIANARHLGNHTALLHLLTSIIELSGHPKCPLLTEATKTIALDTLMNISSHLHLLPVNRLSDLLLSNPPSDSPSSDLHSKQFTALQIYFARKNTFAPNSADITPFNTNDDDVDAVVASICGKHVKATLELYLVVQTNLGRNPVGAVCQTAKSKVLPISSMSRTNYCLNIELFSELSTLTDNSKFFTNIPDVVITNIINLLNYPRQGYDSNDYPDPCKSKTSKVLCYNVGETLDDYVDNYMRGCGLEALNKLCNISFLMKCRIGKSQDYKIVDILVNLIGSRSISNDARVWVMNLLVFLKTVPEIKVKLGFYERYFVKLATGSGGGEKGVVSNFVVQYLL